jgi:hypothetical protein
MKFIRYIAYLLYSYYSKGPRKTVAYTSAIGILTVMTLVHIAIAIILFNGSDYFANLFSNNRALSYLVILLIGAPIFIVYFHAINKNKLEQMKESLGYEFFEKEFNHRAWLFAYIIFLFGSFAALVVIYR